MVECEEGGEVRADSVIELAVEGGDGRVREGEDVGRGVDGEGLSLWGGRSGGRW